MGKRMQFDAAGRVIGMIEDYECVEVASLGGERTLYPVNQLPWEQRQARAFKSFDWTAEQLQRCSNVMAGIHRRLDQVMARRKARSKAGRYRAGGYAGT